MQDQKPLKFVGTAGDYFVLFLVTLLLTYVPIFGWAFLLNFTSSWFADNLEVNGKGVEFKAGYGEALVFILVNTLLLIVTLGIYSFWFVPKVYRYAVDHMNYEGAAAPLEPADEAPAPVADEQATSTEASAEAETTESAAPAETASESAAPTAPVTPVAVNDVSPSSTPTSVPVSSEEESSEEDKPAPSVG